MKKYLIKGLGDFFDGLIVEAEMSHRTTSTADDIYRVTRIEQRNPLFNKFSLPVYPGLYVRKTNLVMFDYPTVDDEDPKNPFGNFVVESRFERGYINVVLAKYENAVTVKVKNGSNTLYSQNFFKNRDRVLTWIDNAFDDAEYDMDNLVFNLRNLEDERD